MEPIGRPSFGNPKPSGPRSRHRFDEDRAGAVVAAVLHNASVRALSMKQTDESSV